MAERKMTEKGPQLQKDKPYKGNTLAGNIGNVVSQAKQGYQEFANMQPQYKERIKQQNQKNLDAIKKAGKFIFGAPEENVDPGQRIQQSKKGDLKSLNVKEVYDVSGAMPGAPEQTSYQGGGTQSPTQTWTVPSGNVVGATVNNTPIQQGVTNQNPYAVDQTRNLAPGTDPIAYRENYDPNNITQEGMQQGEQGVQQGTEQNTPAFGDSLTDQGGMVYGRGSGDRNNQIVTNADPFSPDAISIRQREANYQSLQSMSDYDIAMMEASGYSVYGETAMRDLAVNDPAKYQRIQEQKRLIQQGDVVNAIASGDKANTTIQTQNAVNVVNDSIDKWVQANSTARSYDDTLSVLTGILSNNQTASSVTDIMENLNIKIADVEEQIANLPKTVKKQFKGDVPQYVYEAKIANEGQKLQSELNKLQSQFGNALEVYKTQLSNAQWMAEMDLKERQYNFNVNQQNWENAFKTRQQAWTEQYQAQSLMLNNIKTDKNGKPYVINADGTYTYLTDATYRQAVQQQIDLGIDTLNTVWKDGVNGGQCEAFSDKFNNTLYGKTMLPVDQAGNYIQGRTETTAWEKAQYVNSARPGKGMTAIFNYGDRANVSDGAKKRGHTMIVTGYDPITGMISLRGSNRTGDEKVYSTEMSLDDFYNKYRGVGFWDPTQPTWFETQNGAVATTNPIGQMQAVFDDLFTNATTDGQRNVLATAETMYGTLSELRDDGTLYELIKSRDLEKMLLSFNQKDFTKAGEDGGTLIMEQINKYIQKNAVGVESQIALNKFLRLIELKLRKESGAAISSSEWYSNFQMMIPQSYENERLMYAKLDNWDDLIRYYARSGGMKSRDEYIPIFANGVSSGRETW